jgi:hypothetical protein
VGGYAIGRPTIPGGGRRNLTPDPGTDMHGRSGMQSHGCTNPETCSEGCLAATRNSDRDEYNRMLSTEPRNHMIITE